MQRISYSGLGERSFCQKALHAAQVQNWSLLVQSLSEWLGQLPAQQLEADIDRQQILILALIALQEGDFNDRWEASKLFPVLGAIAVPDLIALLQDDHTDADIRWFASRIVGEFRQPDVLQALIQLVQTSRSDELCNAAAIALTSFGETAIEQLIPLLENDQTRSLAVRVMAQIGHPAILQPLLQVVNDPDPFLRTMAIEAVGRFADRQVLPVLTAAIDDEDAGVRRAAVTAMSLRTDLLNSSEAVQLIAPILRDDDLQVAQQAAIALSRIGTSEAVMALLQELHAFHSPLALQVEVVRALGWTANVIALDGFLQLLDRGRWVNSNLDVLTELALALGRLGTSFPTTAVSGLLALLRHPSTVEPQLKQAIALELGHLGDAAALDTLVHLLADQDFGVRLHAIAALKKLPSPLAYQRLVALSQAKDVVPLQEGLLFALKKWGNAPD